MGHYIFFTVPFFFFIFTLVCLVCLSTLAAPHFVLVPFNTTLFAYGKKKSSSLLIDFIMALCILLVEDKFFCLGLMQAIDRFRGNEHGILVATDVAARGLDIPGVRTVVHYQLPHSAEVSRYSWDFLSSVC